MSKVVLILTVGTGTQDSSHSLRDALVGSVKTSNASHVYLVCSNSGPELAESVKAGLGDNWSCSIQKLNSGDEDRVDKCYSQIRDLVLRVERDIEPDAIDIDFTSGTKAMSAGAVLAAASLEVRCLRYISGDRLSGIVQSGSEDFRAYTLPNYLADSRLKLAVAEFEKLRFGASRDLINSIDSKHLGDEQGEDRTRLLKLVDAYEAWDAFRHEDAREAFKDCCHLPERLRKYQLPIDLWEFIKRLAPKGSSQDAGGKRIPTEDLAADLYNNALRRMKEGKYDDACARLYRLTEMCGQIALLQKGIDTGLVFEEQVPEKARHKFAFDFEKDGKRCAKLGLHQTFELLRDLGEDVMGQLVHPKGQFANLLTRRNESILAHGFSPIGQADCESFAAKVIELASAACPGFEERARQIQFPWLK